MHTKQYHEHSAFDMRRWAYSDVRQSSGMQRRSPNAKTLQISHTVPDGFWVAHLLRIILENTFQNLDNTGQDYQADKLRAGETEGTRTQRTSQSSRGLEHNARN
jgi:hypothetical protein